MIPFVLAVYPSLPVKNVAQRIALAKSKPGVLNYGASVVGSQARLRMELFKLHTGINMLFVSYRGAGPVMNAVMSGDVTRDTHDRRNECAWLRSDPVARHVCTGEDSGADRQVAAYGDSSYIATTTDAGIFYPRGR